MTSEWVTNVHNGYRTKIVKLENVTIEINRPILTQVEQKKREEHVIEALKRFGKESNYGSR